MRRQRRGLSDEGSWDPSPDVLDGLASLTVHPVIRLVCASDIAGHPSPREAREWPLGDLAAVLIMEEASQEAQRQARARMRAESRSRGRR
jgi:hypothetical protein